MLAAHSANSSGARHALADHLRGTSTLARQFGEAFGAGDLAAYLGLVHDVGKANCGWQERLAVAEVSGPARWSTKGSGPTTVGRPRATAEEWLSPSVSRPRCTSAPQWSPPPNKILSATLPFR